MSKAEEKSKETQETKEKVEEKETAKKVDKKSDTKKKSSKKKDDDKIEKLEKELADSKDQLLRTAAEYQNFRNRSAKEKDQTYAIAKIDTIKELLPTVDNLERAIASENGDFEALKKGLEMTLSGLTTALEKLGIETYGESGDKFDPNLHNAVMHVDDDSLDENVITDVFQKGYKLGERIVREAVVKTAN